MISFCCYSQLVDLSSGSLVDLLNHLIKSTNYVDYLAKRKSVEPDDSIDENIHELLADARSKSIKNTKPESLRIHNGLRMMDT